MIRKSVWHIESTWLLSRIGLAILVAVLGSLGLKISSPAILLAAAAALFLLVYRLRYKRL